MDYKQKIEDIKVALGIQKEVELSDESEAKEKEVAAPAPQFASVEELSAIRGEMDNFKKEIAEMLSAFAENMNKTEKNKVPVEASKEEVKEEIVEADVEAKTEEVKEEVVNMAAETVVHSPEEVEKKAPLFDNLELSNNMTVAERAMARVIAMSN